jgi:hypothetical protein
VSDPKREQLSDGAEVTADDLDLVASFLEDFDAALGAAANAETYAGE